MKEHLPTDKGSDKPQLTVGVAIPSGELWEAQFGVCLTMACAWYAMDRIPGYGVQTLHLINQRSSALSVNRDMIVDTTLKTKCDFVLSIDTDHTFPKDIIRRLVAHDVDFVAANCVTKEIPSRTTAVTIDGRPLYTRPSDSGLVEVLQVGTGIFMFKPRLFEKVPRPWFPVEWSPEEQRYVGMDIRFCRRARAAGFRLFVDQALSWECHHVGRFHYSHALIDVPEQDDAERLTGTR
jgi:hypothetical protein